jgi:hypothetical protein
MSAATAQPHQQVAYESSVRTRYGLTFLASVLLVVGGQVIQLTGPQAPNQEITTQLLTIHRRVTTDLIGAAVVAVGFLLLAYGLAWIGAISRARDERQPGFPRWLLLVGAVLSAVTAVINELVLAHAASQFVRSPLRSYPDAKQILHGPALGILQLLGYAGAILLPAGIIWIVLNAMRTGLLPKPVAYLGVGAAVMFLVPIFGPIGILLQAGWLGTMAMLVGGRWPGGDPPAWREGVAVPWPSGSQMAAARGAQRGGRGPGGGGPAGRGAAGGRARARRADADALEGTAAPDAAARTRAATPKRKRKKR